MHLFINGDEKSFADSLSLAQLIEQLGMKGDRVAVELNREIVSRAQWPETSLRTAIGWRLCTSSAAASTRITGTTINLSNVKARESRTALG